MEQSAAEEKEKQMMLQKQQELEKMINQIEADKPENWGLKKMEDGDSEKNQEVYEDNMRKALKKLELHTKIQNMKENQQPPSAQQKKEEEQAQKQMLQNQKAELLQARNAQRQDNLMRATMGQGFKIDAKKEENSKPVESKKLDVPQAKKDDPMRATS